MVPPDVPEFFLPRRVRSPPGAALLYRPALLGVARLHYADKKAGVDHWETLALLRPIGEEMPADVWEGRRGSRRQRPRAGQDARAGRELRAAARPELARAKCYAEWTKALKNYLYREWKLTIWSCPELKAYSRPRETERDFRLRLSQGSREQRDAAIEELRAKYAPKRDRLQEEVREARERLEREQAQASTSTWDAAVSLGSSVARRFHAGSQDDQQDQRGQGHEPPPRPPAGPCSSAATSARPQADLDAALEKFTDLEIEFQDEIENLEATRRPEALAQGRADRAGPRKADITVEQVVLAWTPWKADAGAARGAYRST